MTSRSAAPEPETPEVDEALRDGRHIGKLVILARSLERRLSLAQTEIKGHMRVEDELKEQLQIAQSKAQVMHDLHDALGVKWGCDPYAEIRRLKGIEKLCDEILAQNSKAHARIAELEKDAARYRWLRNDTSLDIMQYGRYLDAPKDIDAAIDEALKERA
jgi:transcriptional accessory protein Tex/SPT6